eukprot:g44767.t1
MVSSLSTLVLYYACIFIFVDVCIGALGAALRLSEDEIELTYQTNHLGPFLLTQLLLPILQSNTPSRIVHVSSVVHNVGRLDRQAYSASQRNADPQAKVAVRGGLSAYSDSKLFQVMYSKELDARLAADAGLQGKRVTSNVVHPGFVQSGIYRYVDSEWNFRLQTWIRSWLARSTAGAYTTVIVATDPRLEGLGGRYFEDRCIADELCRNCLGCVAEFGVHTHPVAHDKEARTWLWDTSATLTGWEDVYSSV